MEETPPTRKRLALGLSAVLGAAGLYVALPASAQTVEPEVHLIDQTSNAECDEFDTEFGGGQTWIELTKFDPPEDGTQEGVTIDVDEDGTGFTWTSTIGIDAVYVKSGSGGSNLYVYAPTADSPEATSGSGETPGAVQGISHISFCYDETNPTTSSTSSTSSTSTTSTTAPTTTTTAPTTTTTPAGPKAPVAPAAQPVTGQPTYTG